MFKSCAGLVALSSLLLSGAALAQEKIKVGVTATLEGTYTVLGEDGIRGHQTALNALGKKVGDKEIEFIIASTDATPDSAIRAVRKLIEQDKVQILLVAAVRRRRHRGQELCQDASRTDLRQRALPAPRKPLTSTRRRTSSASTWTARSGRSALANTPTRPRAIERSRPSAKTIRSSTRRCSGWCSSSAAPAERSPNRQWVPLGTKDFASVIAALPDDVDAIYLGLGGADAVNFLNQYQQAGGKAQADGRLDHGRPDHPLRQGQRQECAASAPSAGQRPGRYLGGSEAGRNS